MFQSNQEFRLNKTVDGNSCVHGGERQQKILAFETASKNPGWYAQVRPLGCAPSYYTVEDLKLSFKTESFVLIT